jgi:small subunit ribosomal protein S5
MARQRPDEIEKKEFSETVISIDRVARVVKGGRRFRFRATVVVGDTKTRVGVGVAKGADVQTAVTKAVDTAKKNMITIVVDNETIPHEIAGRVGGARVMLKPAPAGTGLNAGGTMRNVLDVTGLKNIICKSLGSSNKINVAYATVQALGSSVAKENWVTADLHEGVRKSRASAKKQTAKKADKVKTEA